MKWEVSTSRSILIAVLLFSCTVIENAISAKETVCFADANLESAVEKELGIRDPNTTDMLALTKLHARHEGILELKGIEHVANLMELRLDDNQIRDMTAVSRLTNLRHLSLNHNRITDISAVSGLQNLRRLFLSHNQIRDVSAVLGLKNLETLELNYNEHNDIRFGSGLTNLSFIEALDKNAQLWTDPNMKNVESRSHGGLAGLIARNITEHLEYLMNKPNGFSELKSIINEKFQDEPSNPKGRYYLKDRFGAHFIMHRSVIAYFLSFLFSNEHNNSRRYSSIGFLYRGDGRGLLPDGKWTSAPGYSSAVFHSPPNADIFEADGSLCVLDWVRIPGTGHFSTFTLSTIENNKIAALNSHEMCGDVVSYDFDKKILSTREYKDGVKQESSHGYKAVYDMTYRIGGDIEKTREQCLNPWYPVVKEYLEAIWERDLEKAKQFVADTDILERTRNYRCWDPDTPIHSVEELNLEGEGIRKETKTVLLHYEHMGKKDWFSGCEALDSKEFNGKWKIIDIRNK